MVDIARDLVPGLAQTTSYRLPALTVGPTSKHVVCGFAAGKCLLSWYPFSSATITTLADELADFETTKESVHFSAGKPLPDALVRQLVIARLAEIPG